MSEHAPEDTSGCIGETITERWCPECAATDIDRTVPAVEAVCTVCGIVITDLAATTVEPTPEPPDEDTAERAEWTDVYTVSDSTEQRLADAFTCLEALADHLKASVDLKLRAAQVYCDAALADLVDGRSTETVVASTLLIAGHDLGDAYPSRWVARELGLRERTLQRTTRDLTRTLDLQGASPPAGYLSFLRRELHLDATTEQQARGLLEQVVAETAIAGKHPASVAGAALYLSADGAVTQREVADAAGVTQETIRVRLREFREVLKT
ncbi:transcription initiation factor IIB family protein [Halomarina ordinaria]|uniref:Transcription initiation factor IIB n=1 Tax=Halomarina ordinaria TaxID=3033939 RepID=A0ABD5UHN8_9EURY|nr:transcription initiation factor IIB family protein [Halomarina sp. PSRA2]